MATANNPIYSVDGNTNIPAPSSFVWKCEDTSAADAGRTEDGVMHKKRIGQVIGVELSWQNISTEKAHIILNAFNPEYVNVTYLDPLCGTITHNGVPYYKTLQFYVGNRSAPMYNAKLGLWSNISFNLIDRNGVTKT